MLPSKISRYFYTPIILNCKFEIITVLQIYFRITSLISFWNKIETIPYPRLPIVCPNYHGPIQSNLDNSSGYEQTLRDNNFATNGVTILNQQHRMVSRLSGSSI